MQNWIIWIQIVLTNMMSANIELCVFVHANEISTFHPQGNGNDDSESDSEHETQVECPCIMLPTFNKARYYTDEECLLNLPLNMYQSTPDCEPGNR